MAMNRRDFIGCSIGCAVAAGLPAMEPEEPLYWIDEEAKRVMFGAYIIDPPCIYHWTGGTEEVLPVVSLP